MIATVPVEAQIKGLDPPRQLLLFVKEGLLESLELATYDGSDPEELPALDALDPPSVNNDSSHEK